MNASDRNNLVDPTSLLEIEDKIWEININYEDGQITPEGDGWFYIRIVDRAENSGYVEMFLAKPLQASLLEKDLLTQEYEVCLSVGGDLTREELKWWIEPISRKWGPLEVYLNGEEI